MCTVALLLYTIGTFGIANLGAVPMPACLVTSCRTHFNYIHTTCPVPFGSACASPWARQGTPPHERYLQRGCLLVQPLLHTDRPGCCRSPCPCRRGARA